MASTSEIEAKVAHLHLPDASEELASAADIEIMVEGTPLKLHSIVLAGGSRVLRTALFATDTADTDTSRNAAVQRAFEGFDLKAVRSFLKLLYNAISEENAPAVCRTPDAYWSNLLIVADKLDSPSVVDACGSYITPRLPENSDWIAWLVLADGVQMRKVLARCLKPAVQMHMAYPIPVDAKSRMAAVAGLSPRTVQLMYQMIIKGVHGACGGAPPGISPMTYLPGQNQATCFDFKSWS